MGVTLMRHESEARSPDVFARDETCIVGELNSADEAEVFEFLSSRTIHTVFMASLIRDNGLVSPHNRGSFYSCRGRSGRLGGGGLLGPAPLIETRPENPPAPLCRPARPWLNSN